MRRALLEAASRWACEVGISKLELHVFPHNLAAIALYERLGYEGEGLLRAHYVRAGEFVDVVVMGLLLGRSPAAMPSLVSLARDESAPQRCEGGCGSFPFVVARS